MNWRERLTAHALERKAPAINIPEGVGIEFSDGCDVFWVLPGEVTSSLPVVEDEPDATALIREFARIDRLRTSVLRVIRHDLAERSFHVDRRRGGEWGVMTGCVSSSISVGPMLTARCLGGQDLARLVAACYENTILGEPPDGHRIDRYLASTDAPPGERPWPDETRAIGFVNTLRGVLLASGLCKAVEDEANLTSPEKLAEAAAPTGRLGRALLHLAGRLPEVRASCELTDGSIALEFDDDEDDFRIPRRSRDLARRVRSLGVVAAADQLADEYLRLNAGRRVVLNAVKNAAADRGWSMERLGPFFLAPGIPASWYLGRTRREVKLSVGRELTDALRTGSPTQAIRQLLAPYPSFAEECIAALGREDPASPLPIRDLAPELPTRHPTLRRLDAGIAAELDEFAERTLTCYLRDERTIWDYRGSNRFDASVDTWATRDDWLRLAEPLVDGDRPNPMAVLILLDAGDPRGARKARELLHKMQPHDEVCNAEVELAWRFRHEFPEIARGWFAPQPFDQVPFAQHRVQLGDPVARRYVLANEGFDIDDETTWGERDHPLPSGLQPSAPVRSRVRLRLLEWARTTWKWSPASSAELQTALWLGLGEVADAFDDNPYLANGLLCGDRRHAMFDEPGLLLGGDFLLAWSRLKPTRLLGQILATGLTGDILAEADRIARESVERRPTNRVRLASSMQMYRRFWEDLQVPMAIAWKRFRSSIGKE